MGISIFNRNSHQIQQDIATISQFPFGLIRPERNKEFKEAILSISGVYNISEDKSIGYLWKVHCDEKFGGVPVGAENDVEVALYHLFSKYGKEIVTTKSEIVSLLNYPNTGRYLNAIKYGIIKFSNLKVETNNFIIHPKTGKPYGESFRQFVFVQEINAYSNTSNVAQINNQFERILSSDKSEIHIVLSDTIVKFLEDSVGFSFDLEKYVSFMRYKNRRLYRILNSIYYHGIDAIHVKELANRMPILNQRPSKILQAIEPVLEELKSEGEIQDYKVYDNNLVKIRFKSIVKRIDKYKSISEAYQSVGVMPQVAKQIERDKTKPEDYKWALFYDFLEEKRNNRDLALNAGMLVKRYQENYDVSHWLQKEEARQNLKDQQADANKLEEIIAKAHTLLDDKLKEYILDLPDEQWETLVEQALIGTSVFGSDVLRNKIENNATREEILNSRAGVSLKIAFRKSFKDVYESMCNDVARELKIDRSLIV